MTIIFLTSFLYCYLQTVVYWAILLSRNYNFIGAYSAIVANEDEFLLLVRLCF